MVGLPFGKRGRVTKGIKEGITIVDNGICRESLMEAAIKRASGYTATETVEEYAAADGGAMQLVRRKVTTKDVAPDIGALKLLLDSSSGGASVTAEDLEKKREELIELFKGEINGTC